MYIIMVKSKVYASYKDGSDIYKNNKGFYIIAYNPKIIQIVKNI